jgi:predicted Ser/Thr protein kinase
MPGEATRDPAALGEATTAPSALGERPREDELALDVAEARIAAKLFGTAADVAVGRYRLLELVGRGGMGVVWGAWDPELERKVAVKLVDPLRSAARERLIDEARALAKLSHPNIVPVYDVGVVDDRVYIVMEWVVGENLRAHLREPRRVREIVECYVQAARGLAAIHAAGLVHRDFKPENAMIGRDGRVRVLDFGLAHEARVVANVAGTPRYIAPEQLAGEAITPAADQYALCVALREAFDGRELPRWLAAIVGRGSSERPADRFASMDDVIAALGRDPTRVWRRRIVVAGAVAATAVAFVVGRAGVDDAAPSACSSAPEIAISATTRADIASHLDRLGGFAAAERAPVLTALDDRERHRIEARHDACLAHDRGELPTEMYERRLTCLARSRDSLVAAADILRHATAETFPDARIAAASVVDPTTCADVDQSLVPAPAKLQLPVVRVAEAAIERARMLATAADAGAVHAAEEARNVAETTGYAPVMARALLVEGRARMVLGDSGARATLDHAMRTAFAAHDDATAIEAYARMVYVAIRVDGANRVDGTTVMDAVAARLGPNDTFARLLLVNNLAVAKQTAGDRAAARSLLEGVVAEWRRVDDYELASIPQNLALAVDDPARSVALLGDARALVVRLLGNDHPRVSEIDLWRAMFSDLEHARADVDGACRRLATMFPHLATERAECEYEAGWLADEAGDRVAATTHFAAVGTGGIDLSRSAIAAAMASPTTADAAALERTARDARAAAELPWPRVVAGDAYMAAARAFDTLGDPAGARRCWQAARELFAAVTIPFTQRRLARTRAALAVLTKDPATAGEALGWYQRVGGYQQVIAELRAIAGDR